MKHLTKIFAVSSLALAATACDINKTEDGEMPDVDVEGGKMPEYDVDTMDVEVKTETKEVEVPVVDVDMPEDDEEDETGN
jgi:hypothetical protein